MFQYIILAILVFFNFSCTTTGTNTKNTASNKNLNRLIANSDTYNSIRCNLKNAKSPDPVVTYLGNIKTDELTFIINGTYQGGKITERVEVNSTLLWDQYINLFTYHDIDKEILNPNNDFLVTGSLEQPNQLLYQYRDFKSVTEFKGSVIRFDVSQAITKYKELKSIFNTQFKKCKDKTIETNCDGECFNRVVIDL